MAKIGVCQECGGYGVIELHHVIHKSQSRVMKDCELNHKYLCGVCHRDNKHGAHGNVKVDRKHKLELQNKLYEMFQDDKISLEDVKNKMKLKDGDIYNLYKTVYMKNGMVERDELIRTLMGGKIIIESLEVYHGQA